MQEVIYGDLIKWMNSIAWVAVDKSWLEAIYEGKHYRAHDCICISILSYVCLQSGSIKKLIEKKIKDILGD